MSSRRPRREQHATRQQTEVLPLHRVGFVVRLAAVALFVVRRAALLKRVARAALSCLTLTLLLLLVVAGGALLWLIGLLT